MNNPDNTTKLIQLLFQQAKTEQERKVIYKFLEQILCLKKHERLRDIYRKNLK